MHKDLYFYKNHLKELKTFSSIFALLEWDQENHLPSKASGERSESFALIEKLNHAALVNKDFVKLVKKLFDEKDQLDSVTRRSIEVTKKDIDKAIKIPGEFVEEFAREKSLSMNAWLEAKTKDNYEIFKPHLKNIFEMTKRYADYIDDSKYTYDVLLDDYEEGITTGDLEAIFGKLKRELKELIDQIPSPHETRALSSSIFNKETTRKMLLEFTEKMGFDYNRGVLGEVHHPFESQISHNDIRINVSYKDNDISSTITGAIHELGHGLYEQNIDPKFHDTSLYTGRSLAIHESQSRMLENMIGRSRAYWKWLLPIIKSYYPQLQNVEVEDIVSDLNLVRNSLIRIEADEVTYNMHIILRFEIEKQLLDGDISIDELPEAWNSEMKKILNIQPTKISNGCIQDVHWSMGAIGYFPTYSLGNLVAGQLWNTYTKNHDWEKKIAKGSFTEYFNFFKKNIWQYGSYKTVKQVLNDVTGEDLNPEYFVNYLRDKYLK